MPAAVSSNHNNPISHRNSRSLPLMIRIVRHSNNRLQIRISNRSHTNSRSKTHIGLIRINSKTPINNRTLTSKAINSSLMVSNKTTRATISSQAAMGRHLQVMIMTLTPSAMKKAAAQVIATSCSSRGAVP